MKKIFILVMALIVAGCQYSNASQDKDVYIISKHKEYVIYCIKGVEYIVARHGRNYAPMVLFKPDGTISTCLDEQSLIEYVEDMEYHNE